MKSIDYARKAKEALSTSSQERLYIVLKGLVLAGAAASFLRLFYVEYQFIVEVLLAFLISNSIVSRHWLGKKLEFYGNLNDAYEAGALEQMKALGEIVDKYETPV